MSLRKYKKDKDKSRTLELNSTPIMSSEGIREIKANEQRLAAANARASAAKQMFDLARENLDSSNEEVKAAEAQLREARERWPVIEVEDSEDDEASEAATSPKRRKVSTSHSEGVRTDVRQNNVLAAATARQSSTGAGGDGVIAIGKASQKKRRLPPRARSKPVYMEMDSDEVDYSDSSGEDENECSDDDVSREVEISHKKRKKVSSQTAVPVSKRGLALQQKKSAYPDLEIWQPVSRRLLNPVGVAVLKKLRELDHLDLFAHPVCEVYPDIAEEYLKVVKNPMDFRTIEDERMSQYDHIAELQEDIILTFRNCCVYNEKISSQKKYCKYALDLWRRLNDIYSEVTKKRY